MLCLVECDEGQLSVSVFFLARVRFFFYLFILILIFI